MLNKTLFLFTLLLSFCTQTSTTIAKDIKVLVLIIASDQIPLYTELQTMWRSYMHSDPEHFESYFIKGDPELPTSYLIENDTIWSKTEEGWTPQSAGIINKTIMSMEAFRPRLHEFDFILRTNLSSFYAFPRLLEALKKIPKTNCYYASSTDHTSLMGSGSGIIFSRDVIKLMIDNKQEFIGKKESPDDSLICHFLSGHGIKLLVHKRLDVLSLSEWNSIKSVIPDNIFHFRVKTDHPVRMVEDIAIHQDLLKMFYPITD